MKKSSIPLMYGIYIAIGLIVYFLILAIFGLHKYPVYSVFNIVITAGGMFLAIKKYRRQKGAKFKYQKGFTAGLTTGFIATIIFTAFFAIYASELNPEFSRELVTMWEADWFVNIGMLVFTVALMGFATSFVLALSFMQLLKDSWNTAEGRKHTY
jgi:positive regulator of sigma E activity